jgi:hypothetical protein
MKNIKLHASPHPVESAVACPEVWDAEGDSRDLASRCSSNLRRQNLRRSAELHRRPAVGRRRRAAPPAAGQGHPAAPPVVGQGRPAAPPALPRPPSYSSSPSSSSANYRPPYLSKNLQLRVNKISTYKKIYLITCAK